MTGTADLYAADASSYFPVSRAANVFLITVRNADLWLALCLLRTSFCLALFFACDEFAKTLTSKTE